MTAATWGGPAFDDHRPPSDLPGLGRLIFQAISNRDLIVVRNCVMLLAAMVVVVNFIVDIT